MKILREVSKPIAEKSVEEERFHRNICLQEIKADLDSGAACSFIAIKTEGQIIGEHGTVHGDFSEETIVHLQIAFKKQIGLIIERANKFNPSLSWAECMFCGIRQPISNRTAFKCYGCGSGSFKLGI